MKDRIIIEGLRCSCVIGVYKKERKKPQPILIDIQFPSNIRKAALHDRMEDAMDYHAVAEFIIGYTKKTRFHLIETLAEKVAKALLDHFPFPSLFLRVSKPGALRQAKSACVEIVRRQRNKKR